MKNCYLLLFAFLLFANLVLAEDGKPKSETISLANGNVTLMAPADWKKKRPTTRIVAYEFAAPKVENDVADGRFTVMRAGGSIKANVDRWIGQFSQPDGSPTSKVAKISEKDINKQKIHLVDISGTFSDRRGPFAPAVTRKDYRMLGVIIPVENAGQFFLKFYGPKKTVEKHEQAFKKMLNSLNVK